MNSKEMDKKVADASKITVVVNDKPVVLEGAKQTGENIKKAAVEQGVNIQQNFILSIETDGGKIKVVADAEEIVVCEGQRFLAIADDGKIKVAVNDKPVVLEGAKQTGENIKKSAVEQGVNIQQDFVLSIELGGGKTQVIADAEEIVVCEGQRFLAIADDDNS